ncbi:MAG: nuclear transport factor 2 family protein [Ilumatobacteraceae bacterium]
MSTLDDFFAAWSEGAEDERLRLVRSAVAPDGTYLDPMTPEPLVGPDAVAAYVGAFTDNAPGASARVVDRQDRHGVARATVEFRMADGHVQHGQYFVEFADDDRLARMIGFVGLGEPGSDT